MRIQTFYDWLTREADTGRMALVGLYENRDKVLYVEAPPLRKKYMEVIGVYEEPVLQAELENAMLRRKAELIRIAINRREPADLEAIKEQLEKEKQALVSELESADKTLNELPELDEQQACTLQRQYREIISNFHPAMNTNLTETQKDLYQKAVEAYKMQDVEALKLIYDMLFHPFDLGEIDILSYSQAFTAEERGAGYSAVATELSTDYYLAKKLYDSFAPLEEDQVMLDMIDRYEATRKEVEEEIAEIRSGFPFNALSTINDRKKTEEYLAELRLRAARCEREKAELEAQIASMTEENKKMTEESKNG